MEFFQDNLPACRVAGLLVGFAFAGPTSLALEKVRPDLRRLIIGLDFAVGCVGTAYILHSGVLI